MELFTWAFLATFAGCAAATAGLVQLLKGVKPFSLISTQIFSYIVAVIVFNVAALALSTWDWPTFGMAFFNALLVALSSNGVYSAVSKIKTVVTGEAGADKEENE
jgi:hypothetical protein